MSPLSPILISWPTGNKAKLVVLTMSPYSNPIAVGADRTLTAIPALHHRLSLRHGSPQIFLAPRAYSSTEAGIPALERSTFLAVRDPATPQGSLRPQVGLSQLWGSPHQ